MSSKPRILWKLAVATLFLIAGLIAGKALFFSDAYDRVLAPLSGKLGATAGGDFDVDLSVASPDHTPERVVELQVQSMHDALADPERLRVCYSLASPGNRAMTGPLTRFSQMVATPPFDHLASGSEWQIGRAQVNDPHATVLVSVLTENAEIYAYRFMLSRQSEPPFAGCWMTEGVEPLEKLGFADVDINAVDEQGVQR